MLDVTYVFSLFINEIRMHDALHIFLLFLSITPKFCLFFCLFFTKCLLISQIPFPFPLKKKNKGGRPLNSIWEDIQQGDSVGSGKFSASCKYCDVQWKRDEVSKLEEHLSNYCVKAPATVVRKYMTKVMERQDKASKKRKVSYYQYFADHQKPFKIKQVKKERFLMVSKILIIIMIIQ